MEVVELVAVGDLRLEIAHPAEPDALIDEDAFADDEFLPYWAELWPSGLALARHVVTLPLARVNLLELGCGLGLPSLAASLAGADVLATDWADDALELLRRNAERNSARLEIARLDWREPSPLGAYDLVLAADVLYEARNVEPLLDALDSTVASGGAALLADPGRRHAQAFFDAAKRAGWHVKTTADPLLPRGGVSALER
jgi:predicted nicotinamide N-methyase